MNDTEKIQLFLSTQKTLEVLGFSIKCESGGFVIERFGSKEHICVLATIEEALAFTLGLQKSDRTYLRGALFEIKNVRNNFHPHGAVGKVTAMWKLAEEAVQRTGPQ